jgi:excisionase family DNA binding protein
MNGEQQFLRPADIGPLLGVTTGRVYQLIAAGEIPATKVGGSIRIPRDAWEEWLHDRAAEALAVPMKRGARKSNAPCRGRA